MTQTGGFDVMAGSAPGYLAVPTGTGPWPGVVVIHESWGLNTDIRARTHRLGFARYLALGPDLYEGKSSRAASAACSGSRSARLSVLP